jgi:hypothetical protein
MIRTTIRHLYKTRLDDCMGPLLEAYTDMLLYESDGFDTNNYSTQHTVSTSYHHNKEM